MRNLNYVKDGEYELIENYELAKADNFKGWCIHHRDEYKVLPSGIEVFRTKSELIEDGRYYNCPANELIFMTIAEHQAYHMKHITKERRKNMSLSARGHVKGTCSKEHRKNPVDGMTPRLINCSWTLNSSANGEIFINIVGNADSDNVTNRVTLNLVNYTVTRLK